MLSGKTSTRGFTLLEVLVAMIVLGLSFVTIFELFQGGLQALTVSEQHTMAYIHARDKLEELSLESALAPGMRQGNFDDGFRWETLVAAYEMPQIKDQNLELNIFQLTARVLYNRRGRERAVELKTLKMVIPETKTTDEDDKEKS